tara:strand:+ start:3990 stop:4301 length:312 start_codon:yes stop_codon:yes gene_type:complete
MLCARCSLREVKSELRQICDVCRIKKKGLTDDEIVSHHVLTRIQQGCRTCKSKAFAYEAGINVENGLKWFLIQVNCGDCGDRYEEIMEIRIDTNESNKYEKSK